MPQLVRVSRELVKAEQEDEARETAVQRRAVPLSHRITYATKHHHPRPKQELYSWNSCARKGKFSGTRMSGTGYMDLCCCGELGRLDETSIG